jgi:inorganic phosphate transporter, PiT family
MNDEMVLVVFVIITATIFDFVNGFHDASNSIATIVATRILKPWQAVLWASFFNFTALFLFGTGVAKTVGSGMVDLNFVTPAVILSGLFGAIAWGLITWWLRLPTSSSHALLGGYAGAAMFNSALTRGMHALSDPIIIKGWVLTLLFIIVAPVIGLVLAETLMKVSLEGKKEFPKKKFDKFFGTMQLVSSACLSLMHGSNDAQKTAGIITGALVAGGAMEKFAIPHWVLLLSYGTMGLGTLAGGWRIVRTLGHDITRLRPEGGFCAESAAALSILFATLLGLPVSTTHVTTGAVVGVGAARSVRLVRWKLASRIVWAWIITIPAAAAIGALTMGVAIVCGL